MEGIEISQAKVGARRDVSMVTVKGYVDTMTCSLLLNRITEILNGGSFHIVVDMAQVSYVSSAGWGVFVGEIKDIREKGGDLKIVQMTPEVYDVFEMLEFNKILTYYDSIEEAINDFDISIGLDITKSLAQSYKPATAANKSDEKATHSVVPRPAVAQKSSPKGEPTAFSFKKKKVDERLLPLSEKVKLIIIEDPRRGARRIRKLLRTARFGSTKVSVIRLYRLLKKLNLEDNEKRFRFYRSR